MPSADDFYNTLASEYDSMTRFRQRLPGEERMLRSWRERYGFDTALDAACGTGLHAVVLAGIGVTTSAADPSGAMLEEARRHAREQGVNVRSVEADFSILPARFSNRFQAVLVLGNSLPHVLTPEDLVASLRGLAGVLDRSGVLIIQLLNYEKILARRERIVGVNREQGRFFVRFYDFLEEMVQFNVLVITEEGGKISHKLMSTLLKPYRLPDLSSALQESGLRVIDIFGDMSFSPFDPTSSPNLVIVAK